MAALTEDQIRAIKNATQNGNSYLGKTNKIIIFLVNLYVF